MKPLLALAALAAAVVLLRRRKPQPEPDADDSEVVGMPTTWNEQMCEALGLDPNQYEVMFDTSSVLDRTVQVTTNVKPIDWNRFFTTGYVGDPDWRN